MIADWTRQRMEIAFQRVAEEVGGTFERAGQWGHPTVQVREVDWIITLEWNRNEGIPVSRMRAPFHNPDRFRFAVRDEGLFDDLWKTLGFLQDVEVGDAAFDRRFLVKGFPAARVREVLDEEARGLFLAQEKVDVRVLGREGVYHDPSYPSGIDELYFRQLGAVTDEDRLVGLFELFRTLLPRLDPTGRGYFSDPDLLLERLEAPGGTARSQGGPLVFWDGNAPRREAAERLGELGEERAVEPLIEALEDDDEILAAVAARALARLGDERAVAPLVVLLGEYRRAAEGRPLAHHAADALDALGHGPLARAFAEALDGRTSPLERAASGHRGPVIEALMRVVDAADLHLRPHAARALGALGANEALPLLRETSTAMGMRTRLTEASRDAVAEIESRASLPRPAREAPDTPDTHPKPAGEPGPDKGTLPRAADGEG